MPEFKLLAKVSVASAVFSIDKPYDYLVPALFSGVVREGQRVMVPFGSGNRKTEGFIVKLATYTDGGKPLKYIHHVFDDEVVLSREDMALALWMRQRYFCTFFEAANAMLPPGMWNKNSEVFGPGELDLESALALCGKSKIKQEIVAAVHSSGVTLSVKDMARMLERDKLEPHVRELVKLEALTAFQTFEKKLGDKMIWQIGLAMPLEQARLQMGKGKLAERRLAVLECVAQAVTLPEKELCYLTGVGQALIKRLCEIGILTREQQEAFRQPKMGKGKKSDVVALSEEQQGVYDSLAGLMDTGAPRAALLMGVTGSGKTQVYMRLIEKALLDGRTAIMLVPEIALTPQMVRAFYTRFGNQVAVVHSALTYAQRYDEYKRIRSGLAKVVVGTRTGVFAPLENVGVIIIDEEQEYSYKSDSDPRYHARDVAKYRSVLHNCLLLLGSATPAIESFHSACEGKYQLFRLNNRFGDVPLPETIIDDMRDKLKSGDDSPVGSKLLAELAINLERGEQSILFLNRRGGARMALCADCGQAPQCVNCSVALTYHSRNGRLMCHHCGHSENMPTVCPSCGGSHMRLVGWGTQAVEEALSTLLPSARVLRMDADTTVGRTTHEALLDSFGRGEADILIGTQMVAKGLDFDKVTLVGVLDADLSLYHGDYHAAERTFSLLAQVVGRAGRRQAPGRAVIQSFTPQNPVIESASAQDYETFYQYEIESRRAQNVAPFCDLTVFTLSSVSEDTALKAALGLTATLDKCFAGEFESLRTPVLGPAAATIHKLNRRYRFTVSFRGSDGKALRGFIAKVMAAFYGSSYSRLVAISAEINPVS